MVEARDAFELCDAFDCCDAFELCDALCAIGGITVLSLAWLTMSSKHDGIRVDVEESSAKSVP